MGNVHSDWELQRERLSASLDGELTDPERAELDAHLPACEQCQRELAALRQTRALLHALPTPTLPRAFTLPPQPTLAERRHRVPTWTRPVQAVGSIAAMIGLGLLIGTSLPHMIAQPSAAGAATTAGDAHTVNGATTAPPVVASPTGAEGSAATPSSAGSASTTPTYGPEHASSSYAPSTVSQPFPIAPVTGTTLLVGGAAAVAAGSLARRRGRRADEPAA